ncbi:hypothetical protein [Paludibaculum fermentans]|uniref:hypothetical protein n=1 Tax=Paludibaculum fermentans TaxID=1473598 RepID=UPI003EBAD506
MSCQAHVGLLVLRSCGQPAMGACSSCGMALCGMHLGAGTCPTCMLTRGNPEENDLTREAATRNQYYDTYGGRTQYGDSEYFNEGDRESLHPAAAAGFVATGGDSDEYDPFET